MMVIGWPGLGNCCASTESGKTSSATNLSMLSSVNRLVVKLGAGHRHDPLPGIFLDVPRALQVDRDPVFENGANLRLVLQDADVLERVPVHHEDIGVLARL